jgi:hypothetical protein
MKSFATLIAIFLLANAPKLFADGPADNIATAVRPIPPPGIDIDAKERESLQAELKQLQSKIAELRKLTKKSVTQKYLPDVEIFAIAVQRALDENGFFEPKDADRAHDLLKEGMRRASSLQVDRLDLGATERNNTTVNNSMTVRGFRSKIDGSVQPYGVVANIGGIDLEKQPKLRADVWCRGRSEKGLELQFLATRMTNPDPWPVQGVIMIHPFGRYCNANKLAGEVDTLEALEHAL